MEQRRSPISIIGFSMAIAIPLSGCGGGGDGATTPTETLLPAAGLTPSTSTAVYATNAADTLAALFPDGTRAFAPLTAGVEGKFGEPRSSSLSGFYVKEIQSDGANGFRITYAGGDGEARTVHITEADFRPDDGSYHKVEPDGKDYWFWSYTGLSQFTHLGAYGTLVSTPQEDGDVSERGMFVFGIRTGPASMPAGSAAFEGRLRADSWTTSDPSSNQRQRIRGGIRLAANFDPGTLEGRIIQISGTAPGSNVGEPWPTSRFEITNGRIVNGQFTATLTGLGFTGRGNGAFYGPDAAEVGGVLTGTHTDGRLLQGWFGGDKE